MKITTLLESRIIEVGAGLRRYRIVLQQLEYEGDVAEYVVRRMYVDAAAHELGPYGNGSYFPFDDKGFNPPKYIALNRALERYTYLVEHL